MMDYYVPSILIVVISWVSFWLHQDASAPRIVLGKILSYIRDECRIIFVQCVLSISRNKHHLGVHDTSVESGKFPAEGLLHKSERDLVPRVHNILVLGHGRIRLRKYHLQKKVRVFVISFVELV